MGGICGRRSGVPGSGVAVALVLLILAQPGSAADEDLDWIYVPFPIYSPETEWALTLSAIGAGRFGEAPTSSVASTLAWSQRDQKRLSVDSVLYLEGGWRLEGRVALEEWPTDYFGLGNDTRIEDEEIYTAETRELELDVRHRFGDHVWVGPRLVVRDHDLSDVEEDGLLVADAPRGIDGGRVSGLGVVVSHDSRDDVLVPGRGAFVTLRSTQFSSSLGSEFSYRETVLDARQFLPLRQDWVVALHQYLRQTSGQPPFQELSRLGNSRPPARMRGHITGRFRDRDVALAQAELRFPLPGRFSGRAFGGVGDVAPRLSDWSTRDLKWTAGLGLRYRASEVERVNLRLDAAISDDESAVYFALLEAF